jgi:ferritin-like metal-binding protein YciE
MKLFSAHIEDLRSLYIDNLKKALDMEQTIVKSLPDLIDNSSDKELQDTFRMHLEETRGHASTLERMLRDSVGEADTKTCKVMNGLTTEAADTIKDATDPSVRDIALIGVAQQVEHHEIAVYGTLRRWAEILGLDEDAALLECIESEEENADAILSEIADRVNLEGTASEMPVSSIASRNPASTRTMR